MRIASVVSVFGAMACAVSHRPVGARRRCFMIKIGFFACCVRVSSYAFCSNVHLLQLRHLPSRHSGRHRITGQTAQGQQGDHENKEQAAHNVIREKVT